MTDHTINALLDNNQSKLNSILDSKINWLKTAKGEYCPECKSTNVRTDGEDYGICEECDCSFNF